MSIFGVSITLYCTVSVLQGGIFHPFSEISTPVLYCTVMYTTGWDISRIQYSTQYMVLYCTNFYNTVLYCMFYYFRFGLCWCGHQGLHMDRDAAKVNITVLYCTHFYNTVLYKFVTVVYSTPK